ncbi:cellulose-binding domain-containing protein [Cellulomonas sp. Leaf334]|uniref:cellulose-binding domain-containing protein n=1 Tax=Cellulomonas sp. Leaf334 TaxID=1736339 RepID=UPI0006F37C2B|nr:cellulose-binding domain-containing protein [Cellulomonas sp. Leaf334]KQR08493.1 cellulose-binding protein [Cellulomonas sp. Leaf334]
MRVRAALTAVVVAVLAGVGTFVGITAQAATGCQVSWTASSWPGGFTAEVRVSPGEAAQGWTLTWAFPSGQRVTQGWNATVVQTGSSVTASNAPWNGEVPAGGSTSFGFQGTFSGTNTPPTDFVLNGVACNGGSPTVSPTTTPTETTTPTPTATPTPTPTPTPTVPPNPDPDCGPALFCDGLESQTGTALTSPWTVSHPDCSGTGAASVDSTVAHSGSRSLKVVGTAGYCNHVFAQAAADLSSLPQSYYVRFYVRHTTALPTSHTTFLAMKDSADGNRDLRMGGQNGALQWNRSSDDATLPEQSPTGVSMSTALPTGSWHCVELLVEGAGRLTTWVDGSTVPGLVADGTPTHDVDGQWLNKAWAPRLTDLRLGWESYGEGADTLWYDDVAVAASRLGC